MPNKPPKIVIPGLNRGAGIPPGFVLGRARNAGHGPAQLLNANQMQGIGIATRSFAAQGNSTTGSIAASATASLSTSVSVSLSQISSSLSGAISTNTGQSTSLSQISSSLSGAISSTNSLSTAVSTVISGSISSVNSRIDSLSTAVGSGGTIDVEDEGVFEATASTLNFTGAGVVATDAGGGTVDIAIAGGGSGVDVEDEGVFEATAAVINFTGAGVTATDAGGGTVDVDIPGGGGGGYDEGTSFPGSPSTNDKFYRTDRNILYFYDGTRWLSTELFTIQVSMPSTDVTFIATVATRYRTANPWGAIYDIYVEFVSLSYILIGTGNWTVTTIINNDSGGSSTVGSVTVATNVSGNHYTAKTDVDAVFTDNGDFDFSFTENSGSATLYPMPAIVYRLVG